MAIDGGKARWDPQATYLGASKPTWRSLQVKSLARSVEEKSDVITKDALKVSCWHFYRFVSPNLDCSDVESVLQVIYIYMYLCSRISGYLVFIFGW